MAYTNIPVVVPSAAGVSMTPTAVDDSNGNKIANDGHVLLSIENTSETDSAVVTIESTKTVGGLAVADQAITLALGTAKLAGPFPPEIYNQPAGGTDAGYLHITFSGAGAADVTIIPVQA